MKIGILQAGHMPEGMEGEFGSYPGMFMQLLDGHGFSFESYAVVDGVFPNDVSDADGWLITGSKYGAYEDHPWIAPLEGLIRKAYADTIPIIGICFGHQILAQALGGKVEKFSGGWSVGTTDYQIDGADQDIAVMAWHQDQVVDKPKDAKVIGSTSFCENAMLIYGDKALSIQPHPEFSDSFIKGLIDTRGKGVVPDALLRDASSKLGTPLSTGWVAQKMAAFYKQPRPQRT